MDQKSLLDLTRWIADAGLAGASEAELLQGFCERAVEAGLPLCQARLGVDTLHPVLESRGFKWFRAEAVVRESEWERDASLANDEKWLRSPFHHLLQTGGSRLRRRIEAPLVGEPEFPILADVAAAGVTDYVAFVSRLGESAVIGEMDAVYSGWTTDHPEGFSDDDLEALDHLVQSLALSIRAVSVDRIADTLVETYLGRDAGRRVLQGSIGRGVAEKIRAVIWFSDLRGFTRLVDTIAPRLIVPLLNDYADALVSAIHGHGGQVLKFMGDGVLAIFADHDCETACQQSLDAVTDAARRVAALNEGREAEGLPATNFYLALHVGDVFYGNVGAVDRLDFTVIGPAVNEASRISGMCRSLDQQVVLSSAFAAEAKASRDRLVSLGRYALRGVARPQELFTMVPEALEE